MEIQPQMHHEVHISKLVGRARKNGGGVVGKGG